MGLELQVPMNQNLCECHPVWHSQLFLSCVFPSNVWFRYSTSLFHINHIHQQNSHCNKIHSRRILWKLKARNLQLFYLGPTLNGLYHHKACKQRQLQVTFKWTFLHLDIITWSFENGSCMTIGAHVPRMPSSPVTVTTMVAFASTGQWWSHCGAEGER